MVEVVVRPQAESAEGKAMGGDCWESGCLERVPDGALFEATEIAPGAAAAGTTGADTGTTGVSPTGVSPNGVTPLEGVMTPLRVTPVGTKIDRCQRCQTGVMTPVTPVLTKVETV